MFFFDRCHKPTFTFISGDPAALLRTRVRVQVLDEATKSHEQSAPMIAEDAIQNLRSENDHTLPKPSNEARAAQRKRQAIRPPEPTSLDFEVSHCRCVIEIVVLILNISYSNILFIFHSVFIHFLFRTILLP